MREIIYLVPVYNSSVIGRNENNSAKVKGGVVRKDSHKASGIQIPIHFIKDSSNRYITGFDEYIDNPYHGSQNPDIDKVGSNWRSKIKDLADKDQITKQTFFEIHYNLPQGDLNNESGVHSMIYYNNNIQALKEAKPKRFDEFAFYVDFDHHTTLDSYKNLKEALCIQAAKNSPIVAKARNLVNPDTHLFYIATEEEGLTLMKTERAKIQTAISKLEEFDKEYSDFTKFQMAIIIKQVYDDTTPAIVSQTLSDYVWEPKKLPTGTQKERVATFSKYYDTMKSNPSAFEVQYMVQQAFNKGIFRSPKGSGEVYWVSRRGQENFYELGSNIDKIKTNIYQARQTFDEVDTDNMYGMLYQDLQNMGVRLK